MENEPTNKQTNEADDVGKKADPTSEGDKPLSLYEKTEAIVTRQEAANKKTEELLSRQETLHANQRLSGTAGGHVEAKLVSPEDKKIAQAKEFFKGSALGDAIVKANEK